MKDFLGNELSIGDKVIVLDKYSGKFIKGNIIGFKKNLVVMSCYAEHRQNHEPNADFIKSPDKIIKDRTEEFESILSNSFKPVCWPNVQSLMDKEGFDDNATLINDEAGLIAYGSGAYYVNCKWLYELNK